MNKPILVICLAYSTMSYSFIYTVQCNEPYGLRLDYYLANTLGVENYRFLPASDKVSGASPTIFFAQDKALIILQDSQKIGGDSYTGIFHYITKDEDKISMVGILKGAPYLVSYYPKMDILYYSTHRTLFFSGYNGSATIFSCTCGKPISKREFEQEFLKKYPDGTHTLDKLNNL